MNPQFNNRNKHFGKFGKEQNLTLMKVLKYILIGLVALVAIYLILCLIGPKDFAVSRSTTINAEQDVVFEQVAELKNWGNWSPWHEMDPDMEITYGESTRGEGASYSWTGEKAGEGSLETIEFAEGTLIKNKLDFGAMGIATTEWTFASTDSGIETTWSMTGDNPFLFRGMLVFMNIDEAIIGKDFEKGLAKLKEYAESADESISGGSSHTEPEIVEREALSCLCVGDTSSEDQLQSFFTNAYTQIGIYMGTNQLEMTGQPLALYYGPWDPTNIVLKACIPVSGDATGSDKIELVKLPAGEYVLSQYFGDYSDMEGAHGSIEVFMTENNLSHMNWSMEQYITDPGAEPDPSKWQTDILYPIAQ